MSKPIGNLTLKATPVGTDAVAIADSEDSDKTKKVLLSALSGGGGSSEYYHELKNVSYVNASGNPLVITATCDNLTSYTTGIYVLELPSSIYGAKTQGVRININNLGNKQWRTLAYYFDQTSKAPDGLFLTGGVYILIYNTIFSDDVFHIIHAPTIPMTQSMVSSNETTPAFNLDTLGQPMTNNLHKRIIYGTPISSLTLVNSPIPNQGFEQEFQFTTDSTFTFTAAGLVGKWVGGTPTFEPNKSYVISIKNGIAACGEVS